MALALRIAAMQGGGCFGFAGTRLFLALSRVTLCLRPRSPTTPSLASALLSKFLSFFSRGIDDDGAFAGVIEIDRDSRSLAFLNFFA
jgi:hypothetical protein